MRLGGLGGSLWEQEVRTLLRLAVPAWPPCPENPGRWLRGCRVDREAGVFPGHRVRRHRGATIAGGSGAADAMAPIRSSRSPVPTSCRGAAELHALGAQHRNLVPAAVLGRLVRARAQVVDSQVRDERAHLELLRRTLDTNVSLPELRAPLPCRDTTSGEASVAVGYSDASAASRSSGSNSSIPRTERPRRCWSAALRCVQLRPSSGTGSATAALTADPLPDSAGAHENVLPVEHIPV